VQTWRSVEDLRQDQHGGEGQDWLNFEKWLKTSGWRKGERETHCNPPVWHGSQPEQRVRDQRRKRHRWNTAVWYPCLRYRLVVKGLPLKLSSLVWPLKNKTASLKSIKRRSPICSLLVQVLEEDLHKKRSTRIFYSSQSQELHSRIVSKSNCSPFVTSFLLVIFLVGLIKNFLTKFAFCLWAANMVLFS
jgi:hypothetical protein